MDNVLITGITGRSGRLFGELLIKNHRHAVALVRDPSKFDRLFGEQKTVTRYTCDIEDSDAIARWIEQKRINTVFHIAGIRYSVGIVKAAISAGNVSRIILVHTTGIYSKYKAASKDYLAIEEEIYALLNGTSISLTILRPTMIYGTVEDANISKFIKMVDKLRFFPLVNGGKFALQPVNYADLGTAYYQVLLNESVTCNKNYILSGGTVIYLKDILQSISEFLGKKTVFFTVPFWAAYAGAWALYIASLMRCDYREKVQRLVEPRAYSHHVATMDFHYSPMDFREGLKREVEAYKATAHCQRQIAKK